MSSFPTREQISAGGIVFRQQGDGSSAEGVRNGREPPA
jgi:hypothetical protein